MADQLRWTSHACTQATEHRQHDRGGSGTRVRSKPAHSRGSWPRVLRVATPGKLPSRSGIEPGHQALPSSSPSDHCASDEYCSGEQPCARPRAQRAAEAEATSSTAPATAESAAPPAPAAGRTPRSSKSMVPLTTDPLELAPTVPIVEFSASASPERLATAADTLADALGEVNFLIRLAPPVPFAEMFLASAPGVTPGALAETLADTFVDALGELPLLEPVSAVPLTVAFMVADTFPGVALTAAADTFASASDVPFSISANAMSAPEGELLVALLPFSLPADTFVDACRELALLASTVLLVVAVSSRISNVTLARPADTYTFRPLVLPEPASAVPLRVAVSASASDVALSGPAVMFVDTLKELLLLKPAPTVPFEMAPSADVSKVSLSDPTDMLADALIELALLDPASAVPLTVALSAGVLGVP